MAGSKLVLAAGCAAAAGILSVAILASGTAQGRAYPTLPPGKQDVVAPSHVVSDPAAAVADKAALAAQRDAAQRAASVATPSQADEYIAPHLAAGAGIILQSSIAPAGVTDAIVNRWVDTVSGEGLYVYAGNDRTDPSVGLVWVWHDGDLERFVAPGRHGRLTVTGAAGYRLALTAGDGASLSFDANVEAFVP